MQISKPVFFKKIDKKSELMLTGSATASV